MLFLYLEYFRATSLPLLFQITLLRPHAMFSRSPSPLQHKIRCPIHAPIILLELPREEGWEVSVERMNEPTNHVARNSRVSCSPWEAHSSSKLYLVEGAGETVVEQAQESLFLRPHI